MEDVSRDEFKELEFVNSEEIESMGKEVSLVVSVEEEGKRSFKGLNNRLKLVWLGRLLAQ